MRVVVTGDRRWNDKPLVYATLDNIHAAYTITLLVHGRATGADGIAEQWGVERGIPTFSCAYAAAYDKQGGPIRNGWLLDFATPELVVAFPLPSSRGTWDMVRQAKARGLNIRIVRDHL